MKVPMLDLHAQYDPILDDIKAAIENVFKTHRYIMGPEVKGFEDKVASDLGIAHAIACSSGTDALVLAIKALGIGEGDEELGIGAVRILCPGCTQDATHKRLIGELGRQVGQV